MNKGNIFNIIGKILRFIGIRPTKFQIGRQLLNAIQPLIGDLTIRIEGFRLTGSFWHRRELWDLQNHEYESYTTELFKKNIIKSGMMVYDIGANIGYYSMLAAQLVGPSGKIYAFEPDDRNFTYLVHNIKQNGFSGIIIPMKKAVSNYTGDTKIYLDEINPGDNSLFKRPTSGDITKVQTIALDEFFLDGIKPDVIKMDIEGAEFLALEGMKRLLTNKKSVMFIECNPSMIQASGASINDLIDKLVSLNFTVKMINESKQTLETADPDLISRKIEPFSHINLYCYHEEEYNG